MTGINPVSVTHIDIRQAFAEENATHPRLIIERAGGQFLYFLKAVVAGDDSNNTPCAAIERDQVAQILEVYQSKELRSQYVFVTKRFFEFV